MSLLTETFNRSMLPQTEIVQKATNKVLHEKKISVKKIKGSFSNLVQELEQEVYLEFLGAQKNAWKKAIKEYMEKNIPENGDRNTTVRFLQSKIRDFDAFFLSLAQARKARAGKTFET